MVTYANQVDARQRIGMLVKADFVLYSPVPRDKDIEIVYIGDLVIMGTERISAFYSEDPERVQNVKNIVYVLTGLSTDHGLDDRTARAFEQAKVRFQEENKSSREAWPDWYVRCRTY